MALQDRHLRLTSNLHIHAYTYLRTHKHAETPAHRNTHREGERFLASLGLNVLDHDMQQLAN